MSRAAALADSANEFDANPANTGKLWMPPKIAATAVGTNNIVSDYVDETDAFPDVDPGHAPLGNMVLIQLRQAKARTAGGIIIDESSRQTEQDNTQVGKVLTIGSLAFRNRNTGEFWPEGAWCQVGEYVRVPKYQGDRWKVVFDADEVKRLDGKWVKTGKKETDNVEFALFKDTSLIAKVTGNPLAIRSFL